MGRIKKLALGAAVVAGASVAIDARAAAHQTKLLRNHFRLPAADAGFSADLVADLPEPVQRYFLHAIAPGTSLARSVRLIQTGRMQPKPGATHIELKARETLAPPLGLVWEARMTFGPIPFYVVDCHFQGAGRVEGRVAGLLAVMRADGVHVSRSSRHRVAIEAMWVPSTLLPQHGTVWSALDDERIRYEITIDGDVVSVMLLIDADGRVLEATMERYGDVGVPEFQLIPYGFEAMEEATFGGHTVPSHLVGGWWYGTDQYSPTGASEFVIHDAIY
jgi:hypothetical protein